MVTMAEKIPIQRKKPKLTCNNFNEKGCFRFNVKFLKIPRKYEG